MKFSYIYERDQNGWGWMVGWKAKSSEADDAILDDIWNEKHISDERPVSIYAYKPLKFIRRVCEEKLTKEQS